MNRLIQGVTAAVLILAAQPAKADHPSIGGGTGTSGPIVTIGAQTLPQGKFTTGLTTELVKPDSFTDEELAQLAGRHIHAHSSDYMLTTSFGFGYGLTDDLMLSLRLPWVNRYDIRSGVHSHGPQGNTAAHQGDSRGIGDLTLMGQYRFWEQSEWQAALLLGIKIPTGETNETNNGDKLEAEHQPGSGSWDPLGGLAVTKKMGLYSMDASVLYAMATEGSQSTDLGDRVSYNLALSRRMGGELHMHEDGARHQHQALDLTLELNGEWFNQKEIDDVDDDDSGGNQIYLSPGFRYTAGSGWAAQLSLGIPVVNNLGKGHPDTDYRLIAGINRGF